MAVPVKGLVNLHGAKPLSPCPVSADESGRGAPRSPGNERQGGHGRAEAQAKGVGRPAEYSGGSGLSARAAWYPSMSGNPMSHEIRLRSAEARQGGRARRPHGQAPSVADSFARLDGSSAARRAFEDSLSLSAPAASLGRFEMTPAAAILARRFSIPDGRLSPPFAGALGASRQRGQEPVLTSVRTAAHWSWVALGGGSPRRARKGDQALAALESLPQDPQAIPCDPLWSIRAPLAAPADPFRRGDCRADRSRFRRSAPFPKSPPPSGARGTPPRAAARLI